MIAYGTIDVNPREAGIRCAKTCDNCRAYCSGKTATAIQVAEKVAEIISCDSMQVYRGMDIGTAKAV